ncbi:MAG TPA: SDR family oxidoreductase [Acidimicrobiales bacterium]|nr:SDR family oxidoreductase [Acidimicrobiales bacterium]
MDLGIEGRSALVVAGSRGLGRASAEALAREGVRVMLSSRRETALVEAAAAMRAAGLGVEIEVADITEPGSPARLVEATARAFGSVDIVVANAGGPPASRALDVDDDMLDAALNANFLSAVRLTREAVPLMRERGWGRICCIASYSVVQPVPTLALSNAARTALRAWAKTAAQDLAAEGSGITLNLICPGPHATDRMRELGGSGAMGRPEDLGSLVAVLCSEPASFVNGAALVVDGGATLAL